MRDYSYVSHQNTYPTDLWMRVYWSSSHCFVLWKQSTEHQTSKEATWPSPSWVCCPAQVSDSNCIIYTVMSPVVSWHKSVLTQISQQNFSIWVSLAFLGQVGCENLERLLIFPLFMCSSTLLDPSRTFGNSDSNIFFSQELQDTMNQPH